MDLYLIAAGIVIHFCIAAGIVTHKLYTAAAVKDRTHVRHLNLSTSRLNNPCIMIHEGYIKGYEIDIAKVAELVGEAHVNSAIVAIVHRLDRSSYLFVATGYVPEDGSCPLVIVLDVDNDEEKLKARPLDQVDPMFAWMGEVLNGPSVWQKR